jgi:hypothetical protein
VFHFQRIVQDVNVGHGVVDIEHQRKLATVRGTEKTLDFGHKTGVVGVTFHIPVTACSHEQRRPPPRQIHVHLISSVRNKQRPNQKSIYKTATGGGEGGGLLFVSIFFEVEVEKKTLFDVRLSLSLSLSLSLVFSFCTSLLRQKCCGLSYVDNHDNDDGDNHDNDDHDNHDNDKSDYHDDDNDDNDNGDNDDNDNGDNHDNDNGDNHDDES